MKLPFGSPEFRTTPYVTELSSRGAQAPLMALQELLRSSPGRGFVLLETADQVATQERRSIVAELACGGEQPARGG